MRKPSAAIGTAIVFVLAPGIIGGLIPWLLTGWHAGHPWPTLRVVGIVLMVAGTAVLLDTFPRFVIVGGGTPAPFAPTERLVLSGPYRFVRNPMFASVTVVVIGQALLLGRLNLWIYAAVVWLALAALVRWSEEPSLRGRFPAEYDVYRGAVPAWLPRLRPWRPTEQGSAQAR